MKKPRLSIGLPVYNGARYLFCCLDSILSQSYEDFELIISDNASTDSTQDICLKYASKDKRIKYFRNPRNLGASVNFNATFHKSQGEFFKWASYDDLCAPGFFSECMELLENDRSAVLSHPRTMRIDADGRELGIYDLELRTASENPVERFRDLLLIKHACFQVFGIIRSEVLRKTKLIHNYSGSDRVLLAELSLYGRFWGVPEPLFLRRSHPHESVRLFPDANRRYEWFDPSLAGRTNFTQWRLLAEYVNSVNRSPIPARDKAACYLLIKKWTAMHWRHFAHDIKNAGKDMLHLEAFSRLMQSGLRATRHGVVSVSGILGIYRK
ncbi:MAG: glycosyltransferase [Candidatus Methylomirabilis sp.]|nr:glycosyltransferase [Deltaproteobacteria bacterium]